MATILRSPLGFRPQQKRPIPAVDYFSRPLTLGINPNAAIGQLSDSAPSRKHRPSLDVYPNLLGTTLGVVAPATLDLPLRSGRLFESAPRKAWQGDALSNQGFIVYDGPEAAIASLSASAPRRVGSLSLEQTVNLLGTTLGQTTPLSLPLLASRADSSSPPPKAAVYFEIPQNTLARQPVPIVLSLQAVEQRKRPVVFEHPPNRMLLTTSFDIVPDVVGLREAAGTTVLTDAGFTVSVASDYSDTVAVGLIISEVPIAGSSYPLGAAVLITVSLGVAPAADETFTGGFEYAFEAELQRRKKERKRLEELKAEAERIEDETTRQIARLMREQEAKDARRAELTRLQAIVDRYKDRTETTNERIEKAIQKAATKQTAYALYSLEREMDRAQQEHDFLMLAMRTFMEH